MEAVSAIDEAADAVSGVLFLSHLGVSLAEDNSVLLGSGQAEVVHQVGSKLIPLHLLPFKEFGLLSE